MRLLWALASLASLVSLASPASAEQAALAAPAAPRIDGLVAAVFTPFSADGRVDASVVSSQAAWLNATGVRWVFVSGTTGESLKLTLAERLGQTEAWLQVAPRFGLKVIVHVGAEALEDARALAHQAEQLKAQAVAAMPPVFFKPADALALANTMARVAEKCPSLPFFYYHIPSMTGVSFPEGLLPFVKLMANVTNFAGVKYTGLYSNPGFTDAMKIAAYQGGKFEVLSGRDELMLEALAVGIKGFVGSQYNFAGDLYNEIRRSFGLDLAKAQRLMMAAVELLDLQKAAPTGMDGTKNVFNALNAHAGFGVSSAPRVGDARVPATPMDAAALRALRERLRSWCGRNQDLQMCRGFSAAALVL